MGMGFLLNNTLWIGVTVFFGLFTIGLGIFYYLLVKKTHLVTELKAFKSNTPIAIFFQDNKFAEWKPISPINGVVYDEYYGPFIVTSKYVDKRTKNVIIPFDVDMDGDRSSNMKELVTNFRHITNNEKSISDLRTAISASQVEHTNVLRTVTSHMKFSSLKKMFFSTGPHNIKSKIEKSVSDKIQTFGNVNPMQAVIVFGAIFGIIIIGAILLKTAGGM